MPDKEALMDHGTPFAYLYDGSYAGFLTCIYESYVRKELPVSFSTPEDPDPKRTDREWSVLRYTNPA